VVDELLQHALLDLLPRMQAVHPQADIQFEP
jgi:hypothetical protein